MERKPATAALLTGVVAILALALAGGPASAKSGDGTHSFNGTVRSVAKNGKALTINRRGTQIRFVVRASTTFEHVAGLSGLSKGTPVEVHAFRSEGRWIATRIEANPGHDGGGHGADDPPGDDHGSGGHGADD